MCRDARILKIKKRKLAFLLVSGILPNFRPLSGSPPKEILFPTNLTRLNRIDSSQRAKYDSPHHTNRNLQPPCRTSASLSFSLLPRDGCHPIIDIIPCAHHSSPKDAQQPFSTSRAAQALLVAALALQSIRVRLLVKFLLLLLLGSGRSARIARVVGGVVSDVGKAGRHGDGVVGKVGKFWMRMLLSSG